MTTIDTRPEVAAATGDDAGDSAVTAFFAGLAAWVTTTDHKRIGRMYAGLGLVVLVAVGVLGTLLGIERADDAALLESNALLQLIQAYRVGLVFGAIVPLGLGLAIAVAPLQVGARSIAFPRLALTGLYCWVGGLALTLVALGRNGGIGGGEPHAVHMFLAGHGLMIVGLLASAGCVATTVLTTRAPGMTMRRVPLFAWSALIGSLSLLLALPVVFGVIVYLFVDHRIGIAANFGGAEGMGAWIGWAFSTPAVIIYALPAVGVAAELIPVTFRARQPMRGVAFAGIAFVGVAALAASTQQFVHDVTFDTDGETFIRGALPMLLFAGLPLLGIVIVMALGGLTAKNGAAAGRPRVTAAFVLAFLGVDMVATGVAGNLLQSVTDLELIGTTWEEASTVYVVYGTALAVMGGLVFWAPKLWGRVVPEMQAMPLALLGVLATILAALPYFIAGFADQSGGIPASDLEVSAMLSLDYGGPGELWNWLSAIGHGLMALTVVAFAGLLLKTVVSGPAADANPYNAHTIEWSTTSPAPDHNYDEVPTVASAEPLYVESTEGSPA